MTIYVMFRIIGWFIIMVMVAATIGNILNIEQPIDKKPLTAPIALISIGFNILVIWFIYTAMQI